MKPDFRALLAPPDGANLYPQTIAVQLGYTNCVKFHKQGECRHPPIESFYSFKNFIFIHKWNVQLILMTNFNQNCYKL